MASALPVVLGAIGGYFFGPVGFAVGSSLGQYLIAPDVQKTPRLDDIKQPGAGYGQSIARVYGTQRVGTSLLWPRNFDLTEHKTEESAKGGPEEISYSYSVTCALLIHCKGPIIGVRRIWAAGKIVYDVSKTYSEIATLVDYAVQYVTTEINGNAFTFYIGSETQTVDPTMEAVEGVGNVPAYRGLPYIVLNAFDVTEWLSMPPINVEVVTAGEAFESTETAEKPLEWPAWIPNGGFGNPPSANGPVEYTGVGIFDNPEAAISSIGGDGWTFACWDVLGRIPNCFDDDNYSYDPVNFNGDDFEHIRLYYTKYRPANAGIERVPPGDLTGWCPQLKMLGAVAGDRNWYLIYESGSVSFVTLQCYGEPSPDPEAYVVNYCVGYSDKCDPYPAAVWVIPHKIIQAKKVLGCGYICSSTGDPCQLDRRVVIPGSDNFCIDCEGNISRKFNWVKTLNSAGYLQLQVLVVSTHATYGYTYVTEPQLGPILLPTDPDNTEAYWTALYTLAVANGTMDTGLVYGIDYPVTPSHICLADWIDSAIYPDPVALSEIVADTIDDAGLLVADYDVTELTDLVVGASRPFSMSGRKFIDTLRPAYQFDLVETGSQLVAKKRGRSSTASITADDLVGDVQLINTPQQELPRVIRMHYANVDIAMSRGVQAASRISVDSISEIDVDLPLAMTDTEAAQAVDILLQDTWQTQRLKFSTHMAGFYAMEAADVVTVTDATGTYVVRLTEMRMEATGRIDCVGVLELSDYTSNAVAAGQVPDEFLETALSGPTIFDVIDGPMLRDQDGQLGVYIAAAGVLDTWTGCTIWRSTNGVDYANVATITTPATMGHVVTPAATDATPYLIDETSVMRVVLHSGGPLASLSDTQFLASGMAAMVGNEVILIRDATLVDTDTYDLSYMIRGSRGTEQEIIHRIEGERFILLNSALAFLTLSNTDLYKDLILRAVSNGGMVENTLDYVTPYAGRALKCYAPAHLAGVDNGDGTFTLTWYYRSRYLGDWVDLVDVPMVEDSERYVVRLIDGSDPVEVTTATYTITASTGDVVRVAQLNAIIGTGYYSEVTL